MARNLFRIKANMCFTSYLIIYNSTGYYEMTSTNKTAKEQVWTPLPKSVCVSETVNHRDPTQNKFSGSLKCTHGIGDVKAEKGFTFNTNIFNPV